MSAARPSVASLVLPAALVAAVYTFGWARPEREELRRAEARLAEAVGTRPDPALVATAAAQATALAAEVTAARARLAAAKAALEPPPPVPGAGPWLTALLGTHALVLERDEPASPEALALLPAPWRPAAAGRLRTVEVTGRFPDVADALAALTADGAAVQPLRLTMRRAEAAGAPPRWTFTLWR